MACLYWFVVYLYVSSLRATLYLKSSAFDRPAVAFEMVENARRELVLGDPFASLTYLREMNRTTTCGIQPWSWTYALLADDDASGNFTVLLSGPRGRMAVMAFGPCHSSGPWLPSEETCVLGAWLDEPLLAPPLVPDLRLMRRLAALVNVVQ